MVIVVGRAVERPAAFYPVWCYFWVEAAAAGALLAGVEHHAVAGRRELVAYPRGDERGARPQFATGRRANGEGRVHAHGQARDRAGVRSQPQGRPGVQGATRPQPHRGPGSGGATGTGERRHQGLLRAERKAENV
ncbi:hypothetical protein [Nonomuraea sp. JJY05]|uniref:hypothetical protein n=1 Tax=Nonomuraea sp. JJY05 TaxID=3350255 RepID=UPI00373E70E3